MSTLVLGDPPRELQALMEHRRRMGVDRFDEVWEGVYHMVPGPSMEHALIDAQLLALLGPPARAAGLRPSGQFNLGDGVDDFRVPDGGLHRVGVGGMWVGTASLVLEIVSPGDESWQKLPFFAGRGVDEVLIVDPAQRSVTWLALHEGEYRCVDRSGLVELGPAALAECIEWS